MVKFCTHTHAAQLVVRITIPVNLATNSHKILLLVLMIQNCGKYGGLNVDIQLFCSYVKYQDCLFVTKQTPMLEFRVPYTLQMCTIHSSNVFMVVLRNLR